MSQEKQEKVPANEIRIGLKSKPKDVIAQCEKLIKEDKIKDLHLSAVSNSIGELVITAEILKSMFPELIQKSVFSTIESRTDEKDKKPEAKTKRLYPRLEIVLYTEKPAESKDEAPKISEEDRKLLLETIDGQKAAFKNRRKVFRRNNFRRRNRNRNRTWGFKTRQRFAFSSKRPNFINRRRPNYNNLRRPFVRPPAARRINKNMNNKFNGPRKNSGNAPLPSKN